MNGFLSKLIRERIPPRAANNELNRFLQRIRRRSLRISYDSNDGYFSQAGQDKFLNEEVFNRKKRGTFIDIGAADGVFLSNTYFFEKTLGWSGVCVEPRSDAFAKLAAARTCLCVKGCVSDVPGQAVFLDVEDVPLLSGLVSKYDPRHLRRVQREAAEGGATIHEVEVPCYTFKHLVEQTEFRGIDYLSIDTEGGELDLLKTIDFAQFPIKAVSVENSFADGRFEQLMKRNRYELAAVIGDDDIYVRRGTN